MFSVWNRGQSFIGFIGLILFCSAVLFCSPAMAQSIEGFLEGPITAINVGAGTMTVNGVVVQVPSGTPIASPSASGLTLADLAGAPNLPGRSVPGFINGTCLCAVTVQTTTGVHTALDIVVEPAENVMVSVITSSQCTNSDCSNSGDFIRVG